ncbi:hypothetical protein OIU78_025923 [Salix suchowensis]|nr:hypothetical protein OIU78_025923 [Salix suchowensis]
MSNSNKLDFAPLEASGQGYHKWVRDINNHLTAQGILTAIQPPNPDVIAQNVPAMAVTNNAKALILITRHMVESLQLEYMHEDNARNLWVALEERFGNVRDAILPDLEVRWNSLRFSDFKTVQEYYSEALNIRSQMHFCKKTLTDAQMIEKTLSTFPVDALLIARNYRINVVAERITRFHELITAMSIKATIGNNVWTRGGGNNRGKRGGNTGHSAAANTAGSAGHVSQNNAPKPKEFPHNDACFRCGGSDHWARICKAPEKVANAYKAYRNLREAHFMNHEDQSINLTPEDFTTTNEQSSMDAPEFE